jgi:beta-1,4-mannosyl-glycoprotein beta-1,4-N-acetylglucosaminyltransferase
LKSLQIKLIKQNPSFSNYQTIGKDLTTPLPPCICKPEWHGVDCGQPEIMWRAFITSKYPLNLSTGARKQPHNIYYMIQTTALSLETLEIQIMELVDIVNLFIVCDLVDNSNNRKYTNNTRGRKRLLLSPIMSYDNENDRLFKHHRDTGFLKTIKHKIVLINDTKCTARNVYQKFRKLLSLSDYRKEDIMIYSKESEILNRKAINYFRWYDNWPQPVKFRLKWVVYGFFWQYPENTIIGSVVSQLGILEEIYKSDPERMFKVHKPGLIVGDLNHFGGWFCQYCAQILDIIKKLQYDKHSIATANYQTTVNTEYIQNLIATGLYIPSQGSDGKIGLIKLRRYSDKYYSPDYVTKYSWKFDNIVINLFAKWEEDDYENSWK